MCVCVCSCTVCAEAHKTCHIVHDSDETCWHTRGAHQLPGEGLLDQWYDGCIGLSPTPERLNSFNFTASHTPNVKAGLYFRNGEAPAKNDLHGKKIGTCFNLILRYFNPIS